MTHAILSKLLHGIVDHPIGTLPASYFEVSNDRAVFEGSTVLTYDTGAGWCVYSPQVSFDNGQKMRCTRELDTALDNCMELIEEVRKLEVNRG